MTGPLSRRDMMAALALGGALDLAATPSSNAASPTGDYDPRLSAEGQVKLTSTLDETPAFWSYPGVVYAVRPGQRPVPILAVTGCQSSYAVRAADGSYQVGGAIVTFFRDPQTGGFLDHFDNPFTGQRNEVHPNVLSGGWTVYPADGSSARARGRIEAAVIAPKGFGAIDPMKALGRLRWTVLGASVMLMTDRSWNVPVQPQLEAQTQTGDRAQFFDPRVRKMPARFTATTIAPWMAWLGMGDTPGHLVWHSSGEKVFSVDDLPEDYRRHAGSLMDKLTTKPTFY